MKIFTLTMMLAMGLSTTGCSTNPATGKSQLNFLSTSREISLGNQSAPQFTKQYGGDIPSPTIRAYVSDLGKRLAAQSERAGLPWEFHVVNSNVINAFALPGGKVFITRGLLSKLSNEAQLAGVLSHEIGHVTAEHVGQQLSQAILLQGVTIGLGVASSRSDKDWLKALGIGTNIGGTVYLLKFGRDQESQADELGVRYMTRLGYNPVGQIQVMEVLQKESVGKSGAPEFLSTHPLPKTRITRLEKHIHEHYPNYKDPAAYRFNFDPFKKTVLDELATLKPAKQSPKD